MDHFADAREAKEFLISRIVAEAQREKVPLSEIERKMLYFSETGWTLPDIMEVSDQFDREYDQSKYEKKIAGLIRNESKRTRKENPEDFSSWVRAIRKLRKEDHYLSVMVDEAGVLTRPAADKWKGTLLAVIVFCVFAGFWVLGSHFGLWGGYNRYSRSLQYGSFTIDERVNNLFGYAWLCSVVLLFTFLGYSHFDRKRRMYKLFDRVVEKLFGSTRRSR
jgi:hypothetical protein